VLAMAPPFLVEFHYGRLLLCRVPEHTAKPYMYTAKALPCATHGKEHTAFRRRQRRRLPCAKADPRQKKAENLGSDVAAAFAVCL